MNLNDDIFDTHPPVNEDLDGLDGKKKQKRKARRKAKKTKRKAKRATRKKTRKKKRRKIWGIFKRFNPALSAVRNGILLAAKKDLKKMSSRLRYSYLTQQQAQQLGVDLNKYNKILKTRQKLEKTFKKLGGRTRNLKKAILKGRGNRDKKVPLNGIYQDSISSDSFYYENEVHGLGEVAAATIIAAATPIILAILSMLTKSGVPNEQAMYDSGGQTDYDPYYDDLPDEDY